MKTVKQKYCHIQNKTKNGLKVKKMKPPFNEWKKRAGAVAKTNLLWTSGKVSSVRAQDQGSGLDEKASHKFICSNPWLPVGRMIKVKNQEGWPCWGWYVTGGQV